MTNEDGKLQQPGNERRANTSWNATVAIIILATIVFFAVNGRQSSASGRDTTEPTFSSTAILSGIERQNSSPAFRSAEASAFMGGVKLDFTGATMEGNEARIQVSAVMGGVEIRVPDTWTVVNRVTPVLGGVEDHTHSKNSDKRIIIEGTVFMGGLEINN